MGGMVLGQDLGPGQQGFRLPERASLLLSSFFLG